MSTPITLPEMKDIISWTYDQALHGTGVLLPVVAIVVGGGLVVWGGFKIWSRWQSARLRNAKNPIVRE